MRDMIPMASRSALHLKLAAASAFVLLLGAGVYTYRASIPLPFGLDARMHSAAAAQYKTPHEADDHVRFMMEAYDSISTNYWIAPGQYGQFGSTELPQLFVLAAQKAGATGQSATTTREGTAAFLADALKVASSTEAKRQFAVQTVSVVVYNLPPIGRNQVLTKQDETALRQQVANVNPDKDLYKDIGLPAGAPAEQVQQAYETKVAALQGVDTPEAKAQLDAAEYANRVLSQPVQKELYDTQKIEPSGTSRLIGKTLYVSLAQIAPTSLIDFALAIDAASSTPGVETMIIDMRGNIGGALDFAPAFLGLFLGERQYAYDLYRQGKEEVQRTTKAQFPLLSRFKEIAILTDEMTQSTAEVTAAMMKRARLGIVVGTRTRGWGSVENTYPIETRIDPSTEYALLLVNTLTLRDDQQPIEQNGVIPNVDISQVGWQKQLPAFFTSALLRAAIQEAISQPLMR